MQKAGPKSYIFLLIFILAFLFSFFLRVYAIDERPFHNDEGVNFFFVKRILTNGIFNYSHENYHGPSYFYLLALSSYIFGISDFSQRFASAIPSFILFLFCYFNFHYLSRFARIFVCLLLTLSTTFLYYSRYSIHETLLVLSCMLGVHYAAMFSFYKKDRYLICFFLSIAFAISTKETFIIHLASLAFCIFLIFPIRKTLNLLNEKKSALSWGVLLSLLIVFLFYSSFLRSAQGIRELFMGVPQWLGRGHSDIGHYKPYWYYYKIMRNLEPVSLLGLLPLIEFFFYLLKRSFSHLKKISDSSEIFTLQVFYSTLEYPSLIFVSTQMKVSCLFSLYGLASFLAYSYVPYKTPWLIINITVPFLIGFGIWLPTKIKDKSLLSLIMLSVILISAHYSLRYNYSSESLVKIAPYLKSEGVVGENNPLAYVHTQNGMVSVSKEIADYVSKKKGVRILIAVDSYWPLPYYLHNFESQLMYAQGADPEKYFNEYQIIIANKEMKKQKEGWSSKYVRLGDNQESMVYFKDL